MGGQIDMFEKLLNATEEDIEYHKRMMNQAMTLRDLYSDKIQALRDEAGAQSQENGGEEPDKHNPEPEALQDR